ncbi:MAG: PAS domain S-box protein [Anaerolineales bacterium]|nr:PAS domain S-box protein [Anaerolineales bacterium]
MREKIVSFIRGNSLILLGVLLGVLFWILDAILMMNAAQESDIITPFFKPGGLGFLRRVIVLVMFLGLGTYGQTVVKRKDKTEKVMQEEERYRRLVELSPEATGIECEDRIVFMNSAGVKLFGADAADELIGKSVWDFVPPENREVVASLYGQMREINTEAPVIELRLNRLDETNVEVEVTALPFTYQGKPAIHAIFHDITTRKEVEEEIRQRNIELAALNAIAATVSQSLDLDKILNNALDELLQLDILGGETYGMIFLLDEQSGGLTLATHRGAPLDHPCLAEPPRVGECLCGLAFFHEEVVISEDSNQDERHSRRWSDMPDHQDVCLPLRVHDKVFGVLNVRLPVEKQIALNLVNLLSAVTDQISVAIENAKLFEEVREHQERLRVLRVRLDEAEEAERRRLAHELHDQVGQNLSALGINLNILRTQMQDGDEQTVDYYLDESLALLEQTTERIRDVMSDLRPPMLDDYGLIASLRTFSSQFATRVGLLVSVLGEEPSPRLPAAAENALFRIVTEALTNVAKHAEAEHVVVDLSASEEIVRIVIADDGIGFEPLSMDGPQGDVGWGILTMAERIESVGGQFRIESRPHGGGTRVIAEITR